MPVDYSKFDNIEDSDEELAKPSAVTRHAAKPWEAPHPTQGGYPLQGGSVSSGPRSSSGRETLEPIGFDKALQIATGPGGSDMDRIASELERLAGPGAAPGGPLGTSPFGPEAREEPSNPGEPKKFCVKSDGRKKVHTTDPDGSEMVEEFDEKTDILLLRKTRRPLGMGGVGGEGEWVFEVGQAPEAALPFDPHSHIIRASATNPIFLRKDTPEHLQWRIRNLPYPANVYGVTLDHDKQDIVVRTSNKKYFKRIDVPDLKRIGVTLKDESLTWKHQHNTLIISYIRPPELIAAERETLALADKASMNLA